MAPLAAPGLEKPQQPGKQFRNQLVAAVRSINWSYAIFWSTSTSRPGVLAWKDGFYNGEIKTRKISSSADLTANQLILQRSEQLRELYESLLSGECDHRARRPVGSLSPEELGETEWYYTVSMTYAFHSGQGLPGKCYATNKYVWLCHAQLADTNAFQRALLATKKSVQTVVCIPLAGGALELGTTRHVLEDPDLVDRIETSFCRELHYFPTTEPSSGPSANETGDQQADVIMVQDDDDDDIEAIVDVLGGDQEVGEDDVIECRLSNSTYHNPERMNKEMYGGFSGNSFSDELDAGWLDDDDSWLMTDVVSVEAMSFPDQANDAVVLSGSVDQEAAGSRSSSFTAWKGSTTSVSGQGVAVSVATGGEHSQKLLKKAVAVNGAWPWTDNPGRTTTARDQESSIKKNHVISERRRREKLSDMILTLKTLVPSIRKDDKASILAETIAYLKELQQRVRELESAGTTEEPSRRRTNETTGQDHQVVVRCHDGGVVGQKVSSGAKRKATGEDGLISSNVSIIVMDKEVLVEVRCRWRESMMARVFDAIKSLHLDVLSVQASTLDRLLALKMRAQFDGSAVVAPEMISEALREAIC